MDLSRVFGGDQPTAQGAWSNTGASTTAPAPATAPAATASAPAPPPPAAPSSGASGSYQGNEAQAFQQVQKDAIDMQETVAQLQAQLAQLNAAADATRAAYTQVCGERDQLRNQVNNAARRLGDVQRVVQRYAVVEDPVVASDGFTYERKVIQNYLNECSDTKSEGISQQTKEVLSNTLIANQSLRKLVDLLKAVKPEMLGTIPKATETNDVAQRVAKMAEEDGDEQPRAVQPPTDGRLHPCVRVYGYCNYKEGCTYANYPYDACLSHLKGKCRFGSQCHEYHVDLKRPVGNPGTPNRGGGGGGSSAPPRKQ